MVEVGMVSSLAARRWGSLGSFMAAIAALVGGVSPPIAGAAAHLELRLPDRSVSLPVSNQGGVPHVSLASLAKSLGARLQEGPGGAAALHWEDGRIAFALNRREATTLGGSVTLSGPVRRRGGTLWLPLDGAAAVARERFGTDRVQWDARALRLTVVAPAPQIRELRIGWHPHRLRGGLGRARPLVWAPRAAGGA